MTEKKTEEKMCDGKKFNLLKEPWIKVLTEEMTVKEVSLFELFDDAHKIKCLAGETPTQNAAVYRFLLAILTTVFYRYETDGTYNLLSEENDTDADDVIERWREYHDSGRFSKQLFVDYLSNYEERFWLIHPQTPFYQVANLKYGTDCQTYCLIGNIKESNNQATKHHFSLAEGDEIVRLDYAEAARWLLFYNAYSVNVKPDKKDAQRSNDAAGIGRMGELGFIMVEEASLFETLLMNMCSLRDGEVLWGTPDPVWEKDVCTMQARKIPTPDNIPEAYTLISRRISLKDDGEKINGFRTMAGDYYSVIDDVAEQMTLWKSSIDKKTKEKEERPRKHDPKVHLWREFSALTLGGTEENETRIPGLVRWIGRLIEDELIPISHRVSLAAIGMVYGDKMRYTFGESVYDKLDLSAGLLDKIGIIWERRISDEIVKCEKVESLIKYLTSMVGDILYGSDSAKKEADKNKLIQEYYFRIDKLFRDWLIGIDPINDDLEQKMGEWEKTAQLFGIQVAEGYVASLGNAGYRLKKNEKGGINSIPGVLNSYLRSLRMVYPM